MAKTTAGGISQMEAMRQALSALGKKTKPIELQKHLKEKHGLDMTTKHISVYKSKIVTAKRKPGRKKANAATKTVPTVVKARMTKTVSSNGLSMELLRDVKQLTERVGGEKLRELISLFDK